MPLTSINQVELFWTETQKQGEPLVLVHGSWADHNGWGFIVPKLAQAYRVISYDRRGHSQSPQTPPPDRIDDDVSDLEALIETLVGGPAHILGNSFGAVIALKLAVKRPDLFKSLFIHEPPLFGVIPDPYQEPSLNSMLNVIRSSVDKLQQGKVDEGISIFMEVIGGPGAWENMPPPFKQMLAGNAHTFLGENLEAEWYRLDLEKLSTFPAPAMLTKGDQSPEFLTFIADKLAAQWPQAAFQVIKGAGHVPQTSHPDQFSQMILDFLNSSTK